MSVARIVPGRALVAVACAIVAAIVGVPLVALVLGFAIEGPAAVGGALATPAALHAMATTFGVAAIAVVVNGAFGVAAALVLVRQRFAGRGVLDAMLDAPLALSPVMTGLAFLILCGRDGPFAPLLTALGIQIAFAFPGLVTATLFVTLPFTAREVAHLLRSLGDDDENAASTLGASTLRTFFSITLPNIRPALVAGMAMTSARALGEFGAVLIVGGAIARRTETLTTIVYSAVEERNQALIVGATLILCAASMALLVVLTPKRSL